MRAPLAFSLIVCARAREIAEELREKQYERRDLLRRANSNP